MSDDELPRGKTLKARASPYMLKVLRNENESFPWEQYERPSVRRDCLRASDANDGAPDGINAERPCPWAGCSYHLGIDVNANNGSVRENFDGADFDRIPETCALDVADRGASPYEVIGKALNITREGVRQIEISALRKLTIANLNNKDLHDMLRERLAPESFDNRARRKDDAMIPEIDEPDHAPDEDDDCDV